MACKTPGHPGCIYACCVTVVVLGSCRKVVSGVSNLPSHQETGAVVAARDCRAFLAIDGVLQYPTRTTGVCMLAPSRNAGLPDS